MIPWQSYVMLIEIHEPECTQIYDFKTAQKQNWMVLFQQVNQAASLLKV